MTRRSGTWVDWLNEDLAAKEFNVLLSLMFSYIFTDFPILVIENFTFYNVILNLFYPCTTLMSNITCNLK